MSFMKLITSGLIALSVLFIVFSCGNARKMTDEVTEIPTFKLGDTVEVSLKAMALCADDLDLFIQFDSLITDSRCPLKANCIWAGNAKVEIGVNYKKLKESIQLDTDKSMVTEKSVFGYTVKLINVMPYPGTPNSENTTKSIKICVKKDA
jgi:hypothetical protein